MSPDFTDDALLNGRVRLRQPVTGYRAAIDPVLLAAAARVGANTRVLDAGCGTGAAMFCLAARVPAVRITGLERNPQAADFARAGLGLNHFGDRVEVVEGDLAQPPAVLHQAFDTVITNPPFGADGTPPPDAGRAAAHHESNLDLAGWIARCFWCLKPKGRLVVIHRGERVSELLAELRKLAGDLRIRPIHSRPHDAARRVIVDAGKGRRTPDMLLPALVMHDVDGSYTPAAQAVLRDAESLPTG